MGLVASALVISGCAVGPNYRRPPVATPSAYKEPSATQRAATTAQNWWTVFADPQLDDLEHQVNVSNQNIAAAEAAYRQAAAAVSVQRASLLPTVSLDADAERARGANRSTTVVTTSNKAIANSFSAGASGSWQLDVWGRLRRSIENARATADASAGDLAAATLSNQSMLATSYLQLREADAELQLLNDTVTTYEEAARIANNRYEAGAAAKSDSLQATSQLASAQADLAALQLQRAQLEHAIAALVGKPASDFAIAANTQWQAVVPDVPAGVPSELLRNRPDIVAAERRVAAASANIGIQEAAYFPSLTLTGSYDFVAGSLAHLFDPANVAWSAAASITGTVFDAGATSARVRAARAAYDAAVAQYRQTVFDAFKNVEDQLAGAALLAKETESRQSASDASSQVEQLLMNQYTSGKVNYTDVVSVQTAALSARRSLAQVQLARQTTAVGLITALGGGW